MVRGARAQTCPIPCPPTRPTHPQPCSHAAMQPRSHARTALHRTAAMRPPSHAPHKARTHARTHARMYARTHARTHTHRTHSLHGWVGGIAVRAERWTSGWVGEIAVRVKRWTGSCVCEGDRDLIGHGVYRHCHGIEARTGSGVRGCVDQRGL